MSGFQIRVPGTSANLGPGFDSIGVALSKYMTLDCQPADTWFFSVPTKDQPYIPTDKKNLIYKAAYYTASMNGFETLPPYHVTLTNDVPISRGLGSSSTAVVGGIELANKILELDLSSYDKLKIACEIEGHPDNVAPAIYGGIMIANYDRDHLDFVRLTNGLEKLTWLTIVPNYHLETEKARGLLPQEIAYKEGVHASSTANVLVAALAEQNWSLVGKMMTRDQWHQPYRKELIHGYSNIHEVVHKHEALGAYISGAGPTMIALYDKMSDERLAKLTRDLPSYEVEALQVDLTGVHVVEATVQVK